MRARPHRFPRLEDDFACRLTDGARQGDPCGARSRAALTGDAASGEGSRNSRRRCAMSLAAFFISLVIIPSLGAAQNTSGWQSLTYQNIRAPGKSPIIEKTWKDVIEAQTSYVRSELKLPIPKNGMANFDVMHAPIRLGSTSYLVSIASSRACEAGANNAGSGIEPSVCQVRVSNPETGEIVATGTACYVDTTDDDRPGENRLDRTQVSVDASKRSISFRTYVGERLWDRCASTITIK